MKECYLCGDWVIKTIIVEDVTKKEAFFCVLCFNIWMEEMGFSIRADKDGKPIEVKGN